MKEKVKSLLLTKEEMANDPSLPAWLKEEYKTFNQIVTKPDFPCTFGMAGENRGELRYSYITHDDWTSLPKTLKEFHNLFNKNERLIRHGFFLFVEPEKGEKTLQYYREYFWKVLQYLHEADDEDWPEAYPTDPNHHLWAFCFGSHSYFAFGNTPAYKQRKTRDLGNSLIIGFQPRVIFAGLEGHTESGRQSRERIRERVEKWDQLPKHPNINYYGVTEHREWRQYFIGDDIEPITDKCPFHYKGKKQEP